MAKKIFAADPAVRGQDCDHPSGFPYQGRIPCTGPRVCPLCGTRQEEVAASDYLNRPLRSEAEATGKRKG